MEPVPGPQLSGLVYRLVLLVSLTMFVAVGLSAYADVQQIIHHNIENEYEVGSQVALGRIGGHLDAAKEDIITLAGTPSFDKLLNTSTTDSNYQAVNDEAAASLLNFIQQHQQYYRIRFIDATGQEQVRIERTNIEPAVIARDKLQNRHESTYYSNTAKADRGVIYISSFENDAEGSETVSVVRLATKVYDRSGNGQGQIVIDLYAQSVLSYLVMSRYHTQAELMMVDRDGRYLYLKDQSSSQKSFKSDRPELWSQIIGNGKAGKFQDKITKQTVVYNKLFFTAQSSSTNTSLSFGQYNGSTTVNQGENNYWIVIGLIDYQRVIGVGSLLQYRTFYGLIMVLVVILLSGGYFSRRVTKTTQTLLNEAERFKLAVDNTYDHVIITDPDGVIIYANKSVERITGFLVTEILGKKAGSKELWGGQMPVAFYQQMWHTIKVEKRVFTGEITNKRKNGQQYIAQVSFTPIIDYRGDVEFFVGIERDVTHEKEVDKVKTEFVSLASHQLRTPLSAINWYSEMLLSGDAGHVNEEQQQFVNEIYHGSQRMTKLVNALLNVSRLELGTFAVEPTDVDLVELINESVAEFKPIITERQHQVLLKLPTEAPHIQADKNLLTMVVQNLLSNALKYTPNHGQIKVELTVDSTNVTLSIADNGYGIPLNQREKIFTKLFRADNVVEKDVEGTGLGLYIVKEIVDLADGKIWFESAENQGTTFYVTIPLSGMKAKTGSKKLT